MCRWHQGGGWGDLCGEGGILSTKEPFGIVPPASASRYEWPLYKMQKKKHVNGSIFQNFPKFWAKIGLNFKNILEKPGDWLKISPKIRLISVWVGHFFLETSASMGVLLNSATTHPYQNGTWVTPWNIQTFSLLFAPAPLKNVQHTIFIAIIAVVQMMFKNSVISFPRGLLITNDPTGTCRQHG